MGLLSFLCITHGTHEPSIESQFVSFLICSLAKKSDVSHTQLKVRAFEYGAAQGPYSALPLTSHKILGQLFHLLWALTLICEMGALIEHA